MHTKHALIKVNGKTLEAREGEMLAVSLLRAGYKRFRKSVKGEDRSLFCGMGVCFECLVKVNGRTVRACITPVKDGMEVEFEES
ncbi:MAG: (2Fe-2S)-binding protein [Candidatus Aminicenantes bacterium]|nr:(2Fe-2S)-binding protein [Candidatus Aminicenantes bacterium]